eukprot:Rmarinus@m.8724
MRFYFGLLWACAWFAASRAQSATPTNECAGTEFDVNAVLGAGCTMGTTQPDSCCDYLNELAADPCGFYMYNELINDPAAAGYIFMIEMIMDSCNVVFATPAPTTAPATTPPPACTIGGDGCGADASCEDVGGVATCLCVSNFYGDGTTCNACASHAQSVAGSTEGTDCTCNDGFSGDGSSSCEDEDECSLGTHDCDSNAVCANSEGAFSCSCVADYYGDGTSCTACAVNAQSAAGSTQNTDCTCNDGFSGDGHTSCSVDDENECNLGTDNCHAEATCANSDGSFTCSCNNGYSGDGTTCSDEDECSLGTHDCDSNAVCANSEGAFSCSCVADYYGEGTSCTACAANAQSAAGSTQNTDCTCNDGYSGDGHTSCSIIDVDECDLGTDDCHADATCANSEGSFTCTCNDGYSGDGTACSDEDECSLGTHNCDSNNAVCTNSEGAFSCSCVADYYGDGTSCTACAANAQSAAGSTQNTDCTCNDGYSGDGHTSCSVPDVDECSLGTHDCAGNSTCTNTDGSFTCACNDGYTGDGVTSCEVGAVEDCGDDSLDVAALTMAGCNLLSPTDQPQSCCDYLQEFASSPCGPEMYAAALEEYAMYESVFEDVMDTCAISWAVDECSSGQHVCTTDATCVDTEEGYDCQCDTESGMYGDGREDGEGCVDCTGETIDLMALQSTYACNIIDLSNQPDSCCDYLTELYESTCGEYMFERAMIDYAMYASQLQEVLDVCGLSGSPCETGRHTCSLNAACFDVESADDSSLSYGCLCNENFFGNGTACFACGPNSYSSAGASNCTCEDGYEMDTSSLDSGCTDINECDANPCAVLDPLADCTNLEGSYQCSCNVAGCMLGECGDGLVEYDEECDDMNTIDEDGCSAGCQVESNWVCQEILQYEAAIEQEPDEEEDRGSVCVRCGADCDANHREMCTFDVPDSCGRCLDGYTEVDGECVILDEISFIVVDLAEDSDPTADCSTVSIEVSTSTNYRDYMNSLSSNDGTGSCTLRKALEIAQGAGRTQYWIEVRVAAYNLTALLPDVIGDTVVYSVGSRAILDAGFNSGIFRVNATGSLILDNLALTGGAANEGGAIYNAGSLLVRNSEFYANRIGKPAEARRRHLAQEAARPDVCMAACVRSPGRLEIESSIFRNHNLQERPDCEVAITSLIHNDQRMIIRDSSFVDNTLRDAVLYAVAVEPSAAAELHNLHFDNNRVSETDLSSCIRNRGIIYAYDLEATNCYGGNGAVIVSDATMEINGFFFAENEAEVSGGVVVNDGTLELRAGTFLNNVIRDREGPESWGGAILNRGTVKGWGVVFEGNEGGYRGGAMYNGALAEFYDSTFVQNDADYGGAIYCMGKLLIQECSFSENNARNNLAPNIQSINTFILRESEIAEDTMLNSATCETDDLDTASSGPCGIKAECTDLNPGVSCACPKDCDEGSADCENAETLLGDPNERCFNIARLSLLPDKFDEVGDKEFDEATADPDDLIIKESMVLVVVDGYGDVYWRIASEEWDPDGLSIPKWIEVSPRTGNVSTVETECSDYDTLQNNGITIRSNPMGLDGGDDYDATVNIEYYVKYAIGGDEYGSESDIQTVPLTVSFHVKADADSNHTSAHHVIHGNEERQVALVGEEVEILILGRDIEGRNLTTGGAQFSVEILEEGEAEDDASTIPASEEPNSNEDSTTKTGLVDDNHDGTYIVKFKAPLRPFTVSIKLPNCPCANSDNACQCNIVNSPMAFEVDCGDSRAWDEEEGICVETESGLSDQIITVIVCCAAALSVIVVAVLRRKAAAVQMLMQKLVQEATFVLASTVGEIMDIASDVFVFLTISQDENLQEYLLPYAFCLAVALVISLFSLSLSVYLIMKIFAVTNQPTLPTAKVAPSPVKGQTAGDGTKPDGSKNRISAAAKGGAAAAGSIMAVSAALFFDSGALPSSSAGLGLTFDDLVEQALEDCDEVVLGTALEEIRRGILRCNAKLAVSVLEDVPMLVLNTLVMTDDDATTPLAVVLSMILTCAMMGVKITSLATLHELIGQRTRILNRKAEVEEQRKKPQLSTIPANDDDDDDD